MVVFLLLGVIWAAVLVPPWLQSRREARPIASIMSFRSQLWSLQRATPQYGADVYAAYGDDVYDDDALYELDDLDDPDVDRMRLRGSPSGSSHAGPAMPGIVRAAERGSPYGAHLPAAGVPAAAVMRRRAMAYRRRRQVLSILVAATAVGIAPAVVLGGVWVVAAGIAATLLVAYVGLLIRRGRRELERAEKVRYLTPIRAPRPSVIIIGSGAAQ